jgi:hypothetical protein
MHPLLSFICGLLLGMFAGGAFCTLMMAVVCAAKHSQILDRLDSLEGLQ